MGRPEWIEQGLAPDRDEVGGTIVEDLAGVPRVAVEAGVTDGWRKYVGAADARSGAVVGIDCFGESAPAGELFKYFGFTVENVVSVVKGLQ